MCSKGHHFYMASALKLAKKGRFGVGSNPMVGCVIVHNGQIIANGYHQKIGQNHAEINALEKIDFQAQNADIYTTLEPCSHQGKTPPCVDMIIKAKPRQVIIASLDNSLRVSSVKLMQAAGIKVITGILEEQAQILNRGFFKRIQTQMPFVSCKIATSLDGKTALNNGQSQWITSEYARADGQQLRSHNQAIITGSNTVLNDNPRMDVRNPKLPSPIKIVMDRSGKIINKNLNIFKGMRTTITNKTPQQVLKMLGDMGINNTLIEAGAKLSGAFLQAGLIDEFVIYQAPVIMGSKTRSMLDFNIENMDAKIKLNIQDIRMIGTDIKIIAQPK